MSRRGWPLILLLLGGLVAARGEDLGFYVGTTTQNGKSQGIYQGKLDGETGAIHSLQLAAEIPNPGYVAVAGGGRLLYSVSETPAAVVAYDRSSGSLREINRGSLGAAKPVHLAVSPDGRTLLVACYSGSIAAFRLGDDGTIGERTELLAFTGSGPVTKRQDRSHPHGVYVDATGRDVYVPDLGSDRVWHLRLDPATSRLSQAEPAAVTPGSGPRHLALSPDGRFAYLNNELTLSVTVFSRNRATGDLAEIQTVPTVGDISPRPPILTSAEIFCHPSGRWLYVSTRGYDTITVFAIGPDGRLTTVQTVPSIAVFPRAFGLDSSGRWLVAAGQNGHHLAAFRIDNATGCLDPVGRPAEVPSPICVVFPDRP